MNTVCAPVFEHQKTLLCIVKTIYTARQFVLQMSDKDVRKKDGYDELREVVSEFQKIVEEGLSYEDTEVFTSGVHCFTDTQMNRRFNV
jgi:hypothetical protein